MVKTRETHHYTCCQCGKEMPNGGKLLPINWGIICLDCSVRLRSLDRKENQP